MENFLPKFLREEPWSDETGEGIEKFKVGSQIREKLRAEIKETLARNKDIFAWSQDELPREKMPSRTWLKHKPSYQVG